MEYKFHIKFHYNTTTPPYRYDLINLGNVLKAFQGKGKGKVVFQDSMFILGEGGGTYLLFSEFVQGGVKQTKNTMILLLYYVHICNKNIPTNC